MIDDEYFHRKYIYTRMVLSREGDIYYYKREFRRDLLKSFGSGIATFVAGTALFLCDQYQGDLSGEILAVTVLSVATVAGLRYCIASINRCVEDKKKISDLETRITELKEEWKQGNEQKTKACMGCDDKLD